MDKVIRNISNQAPQVKVITLRACRNAQGQKVGGGVELWLHDLAADAYVSTGKAKYAKVSEAPEVKKETKAEPKPVVTKQEKPEKSYKPQAFKKLKKKSKKSKKGK